MKILTYGASGQLGYELMRQGRALGLDMHGVAYPQTDITKISQVASVLADCRPDLVVNAAAYTNVDGAESDSELAMAINQQGPANLAQICLKNNLPLIHISTDYVFDGAKGAPYLESDPVSPIGAYGRSKAAGEDAVRAAIAEHIILRTAWLYGAHGQNFVKTILRLAMAKEELRVVSDQYGCPTSAVELAAAILSMIGKIGKRCDVDWGTYHYCGAGIVSWYDFAEAIITIGRCYTRLKSSRITPIKTADYPTPAARPAYSALDCSLIARHYGISAKPWRNSLERVIREIFSNPQGPMLA